MAACNSALRTQKGLTPNGVKTDRYAMRCDARAGGGKSGFWGRPGAEILVVVVVDDVTHADAGRDPILPTQRILDIRIYMVWICMVKVRFAYLALAHVSLFFADPEPWAYKQWTHFSVF